MDSHQIVDLIVLGVLLYCAVKGAAKGLLSQLAWVVALLLCFKFSGTLAPAIEPMIGVAPPLKQWIAMLLVYVGLCGLSFVAAGMLSSWMEKAKVIDFDKHLGGLLGFVKGVIICLTAMFFAITMSEPMRQIVSKTYSGYAAAVILNNAQYVIPMLPAHTVPTVRYVIDEFNRRLNPGVDDFGGATPADPNAFDDEGSFYGEGNDDFNWSQLFPEKSDSRGQVPEPGNENRSDSVPDYQDLLSRLPARVQDELIARLRESTPEEKQRMLEQLGTAVPKDAGAVLDQLIGRGREQDRPAPSRPTTSPNMPSPPAQLGRTESTLLNEIAGIYEQRDRIILNTRLYLSGVPTHVQRRVLEDWHADAMGLDDDPDPATSVDTRLDDRILRQLSRAGISLEQLDRSLRNRLSDAMSYGRN